LREWDSSEGVWFVELSGPSRTEDSVRVTDLHWWFKSPEELIYSIAFVLYLIGVWLHFPYGGGHTYSDIVSVFQIRECSPAGCQLLVPYIQTFVEYPVITSMFMYAMGVLASPLPGNLIDNYYLLTSLFLSIPTFLLIRELLKILRAKGMNSERALWYLVVTPSFLIMLLLNWYVIGVYLATFGLRKYLEGEHAQSGLLFGLSASANLITALPALGLLLATKERRAAVALVGGALGAYALVNLPFMLLNPSLWIQPWIYANNWYVEGSWMLVFLQHDIYSPLRHPLSVGIFVLMSAALLSVIEKKGRIDPLNLSWTFTFAFLFSTYIFTPQMNMILLPFFVLAPISRHYLEFLAFDLINSLVIVLGYSQVLLVFGVTYSFPYSFILLLVILRSLWTGKFTIVDGLWKILKGSVGGTVGSLRLPGDSPLGASLVKVMQTIDKEKIKTKNRSGRSLWEQPSQRRGKSPVGTNLRLHFPDRTQASFRHRMPLSCLPPDRWQTCWQPA